MDRHKLGHLTTNNSSDGLNHIHIRFWMSCNFWVVSGYDHSGSDQIISDFLEIRII